MSIKKELPVTITHLVEIMALSEETEQLTRSVFIDLMHQMDTRGESYISQQHISYIETALRDCQSIRKKIRDFILENQEHDIFSDIKEKI